MDWNLLLCFVGINIVLIQALTNFNNVDSERLMRYLHRKNYQNPLSKPVLRINYENPHSKPVLRINSPIKNNNIIGRNKDGKPIYAVVEMFIVNGKPYVPPKKRPLTYHGNDKWGYLRMGKKHQSPKLWRMSHRDSSGKGKKLKPGKRAQLSYRDSYGKGKKLKPVTRALISYEQISDKADDEVDDAGDDDYDYTDGKKLKPGQSLIQLDDDNLASAGNFPQEKSSLVYGNLENLGITYGQSDERYEYSDFRKSNNLVDLFNTLSPKSRSGPKKWLVIQIIPRKIRNPFLQMIKPMTKENEDNNVSEILDEFDDGYTAGTTLRRSKSDKKNGKGDEYAGDWKDDKDESSDSSEEGSSDSGSSSEKNSGNPFTLYKGKYRENWMWNHQMDGDHMNVNPYSPLLSDMTATGDDLLFGRKWWYYNQVKNAVFINEVEGGRDAD